MNEFNMAIQELSKALTILEGQTLSQAMSEVNKDPLARSDINTVDLADATNSIKRLIRTAHQLDATNSITNTTAPSQWAFFSHV